MRRRETPPPLARYSSTGNGGPNAATTASANCTAIVASGNDPVLLEGEVRGALSGDLAIDKHQFPDLYQPLQHLDADLTASGGVVSPLATQDLVAVTNLCLKVPGYAPPTT
jgi:hypothetical protein